MKDFGAWMRDTAKDLSEPIKHERYDGGSSAETVPGEGEILMITLDSCGRTVVCRNNEKGNPVLWASTDQGWEEYRQKSIDVKGWTKILLDSQSFDDLSLSSEFAATNAGIDKLPRLGDMKDE